MDEVRFKLSTNFMKNIVSKFIHDYYLLLISFIIGYVSIANDHMVFLSKQVSHRSLGIGFNLSAHMICLIVTVGYNPFIA